ncbi:hypothetical protein [uncultured Methanospirillum sp.]|nr:hypothetical protein [uncultured Methanospirillum sp.]
MSHRDLHKPAGREILNGCLQGRCTIDELRSTCPPTIDASHHLRRSRDLR